MIKNWLLALAAGLLTLAASLALLRWLAPGLIGAPVDMRVVQAERKLPPFYEGVFRSRDEDVDAFLLPDPMVRARAAPLYPEDAGSGPHDLLGFRNNSVPRIADVVVIGDSQTYGNNAVLMHNWPSHMERALAQAPDGVYAMAVGGWGAPQYLYMFDKAAAFQPRAVVVAFHSGNDPLDSFHTAYGMEMWGFLAPDPQLDASDAPPVRYPAPRDEWWAVAFPDGVKTIFTSGLRLASNLDHPAVRAGYGVMANAAMDIMRKSEELGIKTLFTVIPTKELVYARKVARAGREPPEDYRTLVEQEIGYIAGLQRRIEEAGGLFVDLLPALQEAALDATPLYPEDINGHPVAAGYAVIGDVMADAVSGLIPQPPPRGLVAIHRGKDHYTPALVQSEGLWFFGSNEVIAGNGWRDARPEIVQPRDVAGLPRLGVIGEVDPARFGPNALR